MLMHPHQQSTNYLHPQICDFAQSIFIQSMKPNEDSWKDV